MRPPVGRRGYCTAAELNHPVPPSHALVSATDLLLPTPDSTDESPVPAEIAARSPLQLFWRRFRRDKVAMAALAFIVVIVAIAVLAPLVIKIVGVTAVLDRLAGGAEAIRAAANAPYEALTTIDDVYPDRPE